MIYIGISLHSWELRFCLKTIHYFSKNSLIFVIQSFWPTYYSLFFSLAYFQKLRLSSFQENDLYWHKSTFMRTKILSKNNSFFFSISLIFVIKSFLPTYYSQFFSLTYFQKLQFNFKSLDSVVFKKMIYIGRSLHSWQVAFFPKTIHYFSQFH